jgi:outer membrane immunogenic protein
MLWPMIDPTPISHLAPSRRRAGRVGLGACLLWSALAATPGLASDLGPDSETGFASVPAFAWPRAEDGEGSRWAGGFARLSTGFAVSSSKRFGTQAGPTLGFEGGRMWQEGRFVYGVVGGFDYLGTAGATPGLAGIGYARDFAGGLQVKVGALVTPDVLVYAKAGAVAVHENWRFGRNTGPLSVSREDIAVRPDARVGVEWAVTDRLSVSVEAGVGAAGFYR